jgi:hypothetical protein
MRNSQFSQKQDSIQPDLQDSRGCTFSKLPRCAKENQWQLTTQHLTKS